MSFGTLWKDVDAQFILAIEAKGWTVKKLEAGGWEAKRRETGESMVKPNLREVLFAVQPERFKKP